MSASIPGPGCLAKGVAGRRTPCGANQTTGASEELAGIAARARELVTRFRI